MTVRQWVADATLRLAQAGREDAAHLARLFAEEALPQMGALLPTLWEKPLPTGAEERLNGWLARLLAGEPAQYVLGHWNFYGREFTCDRRALIPRADTETLVEAALQRLPAGPAQVIDVGCGTGCVGLTLALERPHWAVTLVDISPDALALTGENAARLGANVTLTQADLLAALPTGSWDAIVSNPPYVTAAEYAALDQLVREHEPQLALVGGPDGLLHLAALADRAREGLRPGGWLLAEIGWQQGDAVRELFAQSLGNAELIRDIGGNDRVVAARKEP